jgi:hypothetical protein
MFGSIQKIEIETILIYLLKFELKVLHRSKKPFNIENNLLFAFLNLIQFRNDVSKQIL